MLLVFVLFLIGCSALFSGLTLAYFSLNTSTLRRRAKLGDSAAIRIYPIRKRGNQLLTTLLFGNVAVNSILSIYLGSLVSGVVASIAATALIFLFGEIIPQATMSRHALYIGNKLAPVVTALMWLFSPICYPIGKLLDYALGEEMSTLYSRHELMEIVSELEDNTQSSIDADEERIVHGALMFSHTTVREVMTDKNDVVIIDENERLTPEFFRTISTHAYSRYPVSSGNRDNIVGILYTKDLLHEEDGVAIKQTVNAFDSSILTVRPHTTLDTVLGQMLKRQQHLAIVSTKNGSFLGVISLEDIIEEIIQVEIADEDDEPIQPITVTRPTQQ
jgi:metal transporter CNNM